MSISRCHMEAPNECGTDALTSRRVDDGNDNVAKAVRKYPKVSFESPECVVIL